MFYSRNLGIDSWCILAHTILNCTQYPEGERIQNKNMKTKMYISESEGEHIPLISGSIFKSISYGDEKTDTDSDSLSLFLFDTTEPSMNRSEFKNVVRPCAAELVGTTLLVFIDTMSNQLREVNGIATAHGLSMAILVCALGSISGGHFNPALSLAATLGGDIDCTMLLLYVLTQLVGGIFGAAICSSVLGDAYVDMLGGGQSLSQGVSVWQGVLCEAMITHLLVTVFLLSAVDSDRKNAIHPLAIGFSVAAGTYAGYNSSGASMNPAYSFGPAVMLSFRNTPTSLWTNHWIYWMGPGIGVITASFIYRLLLAKSQRRLFHKDD